MPYGHGPAVRKLSKIATMVLARSYIITLKKSLEEMQQIAADLYKQCALSKNFCQLLIGLDLMLPSIII